MRAARNGPVIPRDPHDVQSVLDEVLDELDRAHFKAACALEDRRYRAAAEYAVVLRERAAVLAEIAELAERLRSRGSRLPVVPAHPGGQHRA
jgi:hypothetical protein